MPETFMLFATMVRSNYSGALIVSAMLIPFSSNRYLRSPHDDVNRPAFAVASIRQNTGEFGSWGMRFTPNGLSADNTPLRYIIQQAYDIYDENRFIGPAWVNSTRYAIQAKVNAEDISAFQRSSDSEHRLMLQALLADRFKLRVHLQPMDLPVYALTVAKGGAKLHLTKLEDASDGSSKITICHAVAGAHIDYLPLASCSMADLARILARKTGRRVIDQTDLKGQYDFELRWSDHSQQTGDQTGAVSPVESSGVSLDTALKEQLGIDLRSSKARLDVIVVDHVEKPSEN